MFVQKEKILIIDDDFMLRKSIIKLIKTYLNDTHVNYEFLEFADGCEAISFMSHDSLDNIMSTKIIFTDERMEKTNGSEVIKAVRDLEKVKSIEKIPIISITNEDEETQKSIQEIGANHCLPKPVSYQALKPILKIYI